MRKFHRLPNGFGSIKKLSGIRRNPYAAYPPTIEYHDNGSPVSRKAIGYFETYQEALDALVKYHGEPIHTERISFDACYTLYFEQKFNSKRKYSKSLMYAHKSAYDHCSAFYGHYMEDITARELQKFVDGLDFKHSTVRQIVFLLKQMWKFAEQNSFVKRDIAKYIKINIPDDTEKGVPFTEEEIRKLWENKKNRDVQVILSMIYTGFRVSALQTWEVREDSIYGGVKTGKRTVPIHHAIKPFVKKVVMNASYKKRFPTIMKSLGMDHTPHDCRHTFSWLCDKYGVDTVSKHMLMGHSLGKDVEAQVYSHRTFEELKTEIEKILVPQC